jgi:hypothetical protein
MQIPQFERKHDAEKSDDEESKGNHVDHVQCTYCRLPQYDESTDDGEDTEGHIPAPVAGAVTFEVVEEKPRNISQKAMMKGITSMLTIG